MTVMSAFWYGVSVGVAGLAGLAVLSGLVWGIMEDRRSGGRINRGARWTD